MEATGEREPLLADEEHAGHAAQDEPCLPTPYAHLPVYCTIHRQASKMMLQRPSETVY